MIMMDFDDFLKNDNVGYLISDTITEIETSILHDAYEPSERGAGYATSENAAEDAGTMFEDAIKQILMMRWIGTSKTKAMLIVSQDNPEYVKLYAQQILKGEI